MQNQKAYDELKAAKEEEITDGKVVVCAPSQTFSVLLKVSCSKKTIWKSLSGSCPLL